MQYDFLRTTNNEDVRFFDNQCIETIQAFEHKQQYDEIYNYLCSYVKANNDTLTVEVKTFRPDNEGNFLAQKFTFMLKEGIPKVFGMSFVNNDFNDEIETVSEICLQEFVGFYTEANQKKLSKIFEDSLFSL